MEKQRSFSVKPIRFLAFSLTISFSVIFLMFLSTWVIKSSPSLRGGEEAHNLGFSSASLTVQSLKGFNNPSSSSSSSSEYVFKNSIFSAQIAGASSSGVAEKRESDITTDAKSRDILTNGNSRLTSSGKNPSVVDSVNASSLSTESRLVDSGVTDVVISSGNSSLTSFGENLFVVDSVEASNSTESRLVDSNVVISSGNSSLTSSGTNPSVVASVNASSLSTESRLVGSEYTDVTGSVNSKSSGEEFQELGDAAETISVVTENSTVGKHYDVSSERPNISIRNDVEKNKVDCDISKGRWVVDESYPLYTNTSCPFIDEGFNCQSNGRLDKDYMKWRWQPQDCDIPRFNATKMLELIRGKRLVFVGDSINRNQWESMLCMLMGAVKDPKKVYEARGRKITKERGNYCFKFEDYKCTVEYYLSHFLVHESKARVGSKRAQTLRIDAIDKGSSRWRGADILVFNTAHWWNHHKTKAGINYYQEGDQVHPRLDVTKAFQRSLSTWASWVDKNINPHKTRIFFRSSAPSHFSGGLWNSGGHCREAFRPINETFKSDYPEKNVIVEEIIKQMRSPVTFLNITRLSDYRPDAHPSIYGRKSINPGVQDCSHWCLPGVPDNWNELLYYYLQLRTKANFVE